MIKMLFAIFLLWLFYKLVFDFIVPVYQSTKQVRRQMSDIQDRLRQQQQQQQQQTRQEEQQQAARQRPVDKGDYIDFEEVK
ncbi:hypothetical protein F0L74_02870 [Chitinophaga agrisoli]|uniref:DUF4834 family protein n=1 Tax=Chitinophaga agrisoli TaxID=2607653 RepID=A0A5B2VZT3_9BACT|nr:hypothetical protein [Chitinophaga agrisoli]KAA2244921.1 hypothetical protein F0L74_02870 [Chitinophaga agrisoli]